MLEENKKAVEKKVEKTKASQKAKEKGHITKSKKTSIDKTATKKTTEGSSKAKIRSEPTVDKVKEKVHQIEEKNTLTEIKVEEEVKVLTEEATAEIKDKTEFDWEEFEYGLKTISKKEKEKLTKLYEETLISVEEHKVTEGEVINITDREAIVDIRYKSEGVISLNEFRYNPGLKIGDKVEVLVDKQEDRGGQLVLSHRKACSIKAWNRVNEAHEKEEVVNGYVKCRTKGGMIVDVFGIEAFLPGSQIDVKPIRDYDTYIDKTMEFKIVKVNHEFKNIVVSHKALIEADLEGQKKEIISKLEKGQVLGGVVKNITSYGVFVDLGGVDGLVHITDLKWIRINHPSEVVELDQTINVVILDFDEDKTRIQLGMKQLEIHPWDKLDKNIDVGDKVKGRVIVLADYGAFVEIIPGVEGLIHVSEMSWSTHLRIARDFMDIGDEIEAVVLTLDREERKISLGIKQLIPDPWTDITSKYPVGSKHKVTVRNFAQFGVFVQLEEGVDGLIHISDLSWTKRIRHPSEFTSVGSVLEVVVLEIIDIENRKMKLGHKQVKDNPYDTYETLLKEGSMIQGKVVEVFNKGANVLFENFGIEAFVPGRHIIKEDGSNLKEGDMANFKIIEFNKDARKVIASHTNVHKAATAAKDSDEKKKTKQSVKEIQMRVKRSTLGDIGALNKLKEQK